MGDFEEDEDLEIIKEIINKFGKHSVKEEETEIEVIELDDDDDDLPVVRRRSRKITRESIQERSAAGRVRKYKNEVGLVDLRRQRKMILKKRLGERKAGVMVKMEFLMNNADPSPEANENARDGVEEEELFDEVEVVEDDDGIEITREEPMISEAFTRYRDVRQVDDGEIEIVVLSDDENERRKKKREKKEEKELKRKKREDRKMMREEEKKSKVEEMKIQKKKEEIRERVKKEVEKGIRVDKKNVNKRRNSPTSESSHSSRHKRERSRERSERQKKRSKREEEDSIFIDRDGGLRGSSGDRAFDTDEIRDLALAAHDNSEEAFFTVSSLLNGHKELALRRVHSDDLPEVSAPLGAAFDRAMRMWLVTDTAGGAIEMVTVDGVAKARMEGLVKPCAITVITPASHFAILDSDGITLVDLQVNTRKKITSGFNGRFRGLATVHDGNVVTIHYKSSPPHLCIFSISGKNEILCSVPFTSNPDYHSLPCFVTSMREMIYVTDLERNHLTAFSYSKMTKTVSITTRRDLDASSSHRTSQVSTQFMAGVVSDGAHNLLIADARGRSISLCSSDGSLIQRISIIDAEQAPYISGLALSPTGRIMVCCRREHCVKMYDLVPLETDADKLSRRIRTVRFP